LDGDSKLIVDDALAIHVTVTHRSNQIGAFHVIGDIEIEENIICKKLRLRKSS
jgi:hypothetical protein